MKPTVLSTWVNPDMRATRSYVASYTVRQGHNELYNLHLHKQLGFFQISEFFSNTGENHFVIEQTNKVGKPKIAVFEKDTGMMLGLLKGNTLLNENEEAILEFKKAKDLTEQLITQLEPYNPEDYVALMPNSNCIVAVFYTLPKKSADKKLLRALRSLAKLFSGDPKDIYEIEIWDDSITDIRNYYACAVIFQNRP